MTSEADSTRLRPAEPINITVLKARNVRGSRGDAVNASVKVEFGDRLLGESPKFEGNVDVISEVNFTVSLLCTYDDPLVIDELAHKPVILTVIETLPKEKKHKEEKAAILGQCCIDLISLFRGATELKQILQINPPSGSGQESVQPVVSKAELEVQVTIDEPLLDETQINDGNLMTITIGNLYSPPEAWTFTGPQYTYGVAMPFPLSADRESVAVFINGMLKPGQDRSGSAKRKKWAVSGSAQGQSVYIQDKLIFSDPIEDEIGDFREKEDRDYRYVSEHEKNRVIWNMERRCYLPPSTKQIFQDAIAKNRYWPAEIMRLSQIGSTKGKKDDENNSIGFHGVAFINLAPLLYPGVQRICGAFKILPYSDFLLNEKTKRKSGIIDEAIRIIFNMLNKVNITPSLKKSGGKSEDKKFDIRKASSQPKIDNGSETDIQLPVNVEGQQYADAKSYIMVEICLDKPFVPKRPPEVLAKKVAELIPPRPMFPRRTDGAQKAVEDFHFQVANVAQSILDDFREQFQSDLNLDQHLTNEDMEERRQKLVYELNTSGKYFAFKEQLKHSVVRIVREKYLRMTGFDDRQELQTFLSELYVYLIDQMHVSLGQVLALEDQPPVPKPLTDSAQLKHFAREAEINQNFDLAATYYKERIARDKNDAEYWFDFGTFNLYINDLAKAEECFKECLSTNQKHMYGLILYGVVCSLSERNEPAETFFEAATCVDPKSILAWTMLGLFYDAVPNEVQSEMAFYQANKLNIAQAVEEARIRMEKEEEKKKLLAEAMAIVEATNPEDGLSVPNLEVKPPEPEKPTPSKSKPFGKGGSKAPSAKPGSAPKEVEGEQLDLPEEPIPRPPTPIPSSSIFMQVVDWLLEVKAIPFTERALGHELVTCPAGPNAAYNIALAQLRLQKGEYAEAEKCLQEALQMDFQNPDAWSMLGHVKYMTGDSVNARECYERTLTFVNDAKEMHSIYLRLASIYLQDERLGELAEAEDALSEANILNNNDPEVWAYLSLVCLQTNRRLEAEQAYKYAIKLNLEEGPLLSEIHREQVVHGFGNPSF